MVGTTVLVGESDPFLWAAVLDLLPVRPRRIELLDLDSLQAAARQRLQGLDAFVLTGQATIVVIRQGATLRQAELGDAFDRLALASLLWHELAHTDGLDERGALEREQALWRRFIGQGLVSAGGGLAYIARLRDADSAVARTATAAGNAAASNRRGREPRK
jgi:hypothetical protein